MLHATSHIIPNSAQPYPSYHVLESGCSMGGTVSLNQVDL